MKKKLLIFIISFVSSFGSIYAYDACVDGIYYNLHDGYDFTAEVTNCKGIKNCAATIIIPEEINYAGVTYSVTSIGAEAYAKCDQINSIVIPNSVTVIGDGAFDYCKNLRSVVLPPSVHKIGKFAFASCRNLTSIILPENCEYIGDRAFAWSGLKKITIGKKISYIGKESFFKCKITEVNYPAGSNLKTLNIPSTSTTQFIAYNLNNSPYNDQQYCNSSVKPSNNGTAEGLTQNKKKVIPKSLVDTNIPETNVSNPNTFAVIFANEDYKNVASVPFAKNDGAVFQNYCSKTLGIPQVNIHYVENATYNDFRIQLSWLNGVCDAFDGNASVIIYYAGHGIPDEKSKSAYLLPIDGDGRYVQSAYKLDDLYEKLGAMNAKSVTVFMDACFSGSKREDGMIVSARSVALKAKSGVPQGNMVVFSAASGDETAYPDNDEQHGIFTYYLLKKLQETKGDVTLLELGNYITMNVRQQSIVKNGKPQTPCVTPSAAIGTEWQNWTLK